MGYKVRTNEFISDSVSPSSVKYAGGQLGRRSVYIVYKKTRHKNDWKSSKKQQDNTRPPSTPKVNFV